MRFDLEDGRLTDGVIGGVISVASISMEPPSCSVVQSVADIDLEDAGCCVEPGACCNGISAALTFSATTAAFVR